MDECQIYDGFDFITELIKEQNKMLLTKIAESKNYDDFDKNIFINEFLKVGFFTPILTYDIYEESSQIKYIERKIKKLKKKNKK